MNPERQKLFWAEKLRFFLNLDLDREPANGEQQRHKCHHCAADNSAEKERKRFHSGEKIK